MLLLFMFLCCKMFEIKVAGTINMKAQHSAAESYNPLDTRPTGNPTRGLASRKPFHLHKPKPSQAFCPCPGWHGLDGCLGDSRFWKQ